MIRITGLQKSYGDNTVIENLSFSVKKGEKVAIMAPSGCGKTTLLRLLMGLERQDGGRVEMADEAVFLFQEPRLLPQFTVLQNVMAVIDGKERKRRALEALMLVGLSGEEDKYPNEISGGMAQRAVLARALVTGRSIFLLDEPFKGLDEQAKEQIFVLCRRALAEKTVLLVTHDDKEARALCEKIVFFEKGMKVRDVVEL